MQKFRPDNSEETFNIYVWVTCDPKFHPFSDRHLDTIFEQENISYHGGNPNDAKPEYVILEKKVQ